MILVNQQVAGSIPRRASCHNANRNTEETLPVSSFFIISAFPYLVTSCYGNFLIW